MRPLQVILLACIWGTDYDGEETWIKEIVILIRDLPLISLWGGFDFLQYEKSKFPSVCHFHHTSDCITQNRTSLDLQK